MSRMQRESAKDARMPLNWWAIEGAVCVAEILDLLRADPSDADMQGALAIWFSYFERTTDLH